MSNMNNAHLIHDHSTGRSSTRLHAPPGGKNSMGTGFGWADPEPVCSVNKPAPAQVSESPFKQNVQNISERSSPASGRGFGDTGSSSIRLHAPSGGANSMGTSFGWDEPQLARPALAAVASSSSTLAVGTRVIYTQMGKARTELDAEIVEIEPVGGRKDNIRIRFADGRERNTSADKLAVAVEQAMCALSLDQENVPPATSPSGAEYHQEDPVSISAPAPQHQALKAVEGAGVGELQIGQKMKYRQTKASEPEEVTVVSVELPSSNGFMRTKTFYQIRFDDGRTRETTIDKLAPR